MYLEILIGMLLMFLIIWVFLCIWVRMDEIYPIKLVEEPLVREFKCPDCDNVKLSYAYVNPIFKKGRYAICNQCGLQFDAPENDTGENWEM